MKILQEDRSPARCTEAVLIAESPSANITFVNKRCREILGLSRSPSGAVSKKGGGRTW